MPRQTGLRDTVIQHQFRTLSHSQLLHLISLPASIGAPLELHYLRMQSQDLIVQVVHFCHLQTKQEPAAVATTMTVLWFSDTLPEQTPRLFLHSPARLLTSSQRLQTNTDISLILTNSTHECKV